MNKPQVKPTDKPRYSLGFFKEQAAATVPVKPVAKKKTKPIGTFKVIK